jgi:alpha-D-ribose 1-methylphosphonate 5-triphosphate synthase subunit PhnG
MPIQKKKKKKPKAQKTPAVSQKVSQVVKINIGDVKVKPRRKATRKPPAGIRAGVPSAPPSGLVQQVQAPQVTQDVLQQSKELREIVNKLQTSPAQQTLRGQEQGGQPENPLLRDYMPRQEMELEYMPRREQVKQTAAIYDRIRQSEQNFGEEIAMTMAEMAEREQDRQSDVSDISSTTGSLSGFTMAESTKLHALDPSIPQAEVTGMGTLFEDENPPVGQLAPTTSRGRGVGLTQEQKQAIRDDIESSGMTINEYHLSGRNPIGTGAISKNTLSSLFRKMGGLSGYKQRRGN